MYSISQEERPLQYSKLSRDANWLRTVQTIGETLMSANRFLDTVFIILRRDSCNSSECLFDHLEERECYGDVRMEIWCKGVE